MSKEKDSAAFPQSGFDRWAPEGGMSLRDYFAAKALQGMLSSDSFKSLHEKTSFVRGEDPSVVAVASAYRFADIMLIEREK